MRTLYTTTAIALALSLGLATPALAQGEEPGEGEELFESEMMPGTPTSTDPDRPDVPPEAVGDDITVPEGDVMDVEEGMEAAEGMEPGEEEELFESEMMPGTPTTTDPDRPDVTGEEGMDLPEGEAVEGAEGMEPGEPGEEEELFESEMMPGTPTTTEE
jgi:hypothetical protein